MKNLYSLSYSIEGGTNKFLCDLENISKINIIKILKLDDFEKIVNDPCSNVIINNL